MIQILRWCFLTVGRDKYGQPSTRYKRWARSHSEAALGDFAPLVEAIPELRELANDAANRDGWQAPTTPCTTLSPFLSQRLSQTPPPPTPLPYPTNQKTRQIPTG